MNQFSRTGGDKITNTAFIINNILPLCSKLRTITDNLEKYISKDNQPFPQYEQLFFDIDF